MKKQYTSEAEIMADPEIKNQFQLTQALEEFRRAHAEELNAPRPITAEQAAELRKLAGEIGTAAGAIADFDKTEPIHRKLLDATRERVREMETPKTLPDDKVLMKLVMERARAELLHNYLAGSPSRRAALVAAFRSRVSALAARLRDFTGRTMSRDFENPNLGISDAAQMAAGETERVIRGTPDEFERIAQRRAPLVVTESVRA